MRHIIYIQGTRKVYDGQLECPFVVTGQRNEAHFRPEKVAHPAPEAKPEEREAYMRSRAAWNTHQREITAGRFELTTIEWCENRKEAEGICAQFTEPEWINVEIRDDVKIIRHSQP